MQRGQTLIFLLVGILVIAVIGGAFYLGRSTTSKPSSAPIDTSQTPSSTQDTSRKPNGSTETVYTEGTRSANWKNTTLEKLSFKTPSSWYFQQEQKGKNGSKSIAFAPKDPGGPIDTPLSYNLSFVPNTTVASQKQKDASNIYMTIEEEKAVSINGLNFTIVSGPATYPSGRKAAIAYIQYKENVYSLYIPNGDNTDLFNQILSTFRFTQ